MYACCNAPHTALYTYSATNDTTICLYLSRYAGNLLSSVYSLKRYSYMPLRLLHACHLGQNLHIRDG